MICLLNLESERRKTRIPHKWQGNEIGFAYNNENVVGKLSYLPGRFRRLWRSEVKVTGHDMTTYRSKRQRRARRLRVEFYRVFQSVFLLYQCRDGWRWHKKTFRNLPNSVFALAVVLWVIALLCRSFSRQNVSVAACLRSTSHCCQVPRVQTNVFSARRNVREVYSKFWVLISILWLTMHVLLFNSRVKCHPKICTHCRNINKSRMKLLFYSPCI